MLLVLSSALASMACYGCTSVSETYGIAEPAVAPSEGMRLALPSAMGQGALNAPGQTVVNLGTDGLAARLSLRGARTQSAAYVEPRANTTRLALSSRGAGIAGVPVSQQNFALAGTRALASLDGEIAAGRLDMPEPEITDLEIGLAFEASAQRTGLGFDVELAPRFAWRDEGDVRSQRLGGELRFSPDISYLRRDGSPDGWYLFIGADGEALVWDTDLRNLDMRVWDDFLVTDQITVGDFQAGLSVQRGIGQLSLSYIRREVKFDDRNRAMKDVEDFAGVSFTMRR